MPKLVNYPRASFKRSLQLAEAVDQLGGTCSRESCADKLGMKVGGGFNNIVSGALKFELISSSRGSLSISNLYKLIKHSYDDEEKKDHLREAFLSPKDFETLYNRFKNKRLPIEMLDKLLIREFDVDERMSSKVSKYFVNGLKYINLLDEGNVVKDSEKVLDEEDVEEEDADEDADYQSEQPSIDTIGQSELKIEKEENEYIVHIYGPGMDSKMVVKEKEDIDIVNAMLRKVIKKVQIENNHSVEDSIS